MIFYFTALKSVDVLKKVKSFFFSIRLLSVEYVFFFFIFIKWRFLYISYECNFSYVVNFFRLVFFLLQWLIKIFELFYREICPTQNYDFNESFYVRRI